MHRGAPRKTGPNRNREIRAREVQVIDHLGENRGLMDTRDAIKLAEDAGLDLVELNPGKEPVVCKIIDYGKWKYDKSKRETESKKKQKIVKLKEITMRPVTDTQGYEIKVKAAQKFLEQGNKVKVTVRFRGREMAFREQGFELLKKFQDDLSNEFKIEKSASMEGRRLSLIIAPN
ncbi:MAG: translation initiation factor IF-3 [Alphaproteobacteria bacterium]|nr:translation initiation factor IF-3 [Alphaproteobacteria bacterium]